MSACKIRQPQSSPARQQGIVLFVALIALVIMSMVGISMVRQMTSGQQIVGNLAFKQAATALADQATEQVLIAMVGKTSAQLDVAGAINGYLAEAPEFKGEVFNPAKESTWTGRVVSENTPAAGITTTYVVHRLCYPKVNSADPNEARRCAGRETSEGGEKISDPSKIPPKQIQPYYRVTTLVEGDRNSRSITQTMIY